ncbi:MAG: hypothetical protein ACLP4V_12400 [Methylocella sp.]
MKPHFVYLHLSRQCRIHKRGLCTQQRLEMAALRVKSCIVRIAIAFSSPSLLAASRGDIEAKPPKLEPFIDAIKAALFHQRPLS